jgi:hypothetical protein
MFYAKAGLLTLALGLAGCGGTSQTAGSCGAALDSLMSRWDSIGFAEPGKPAQMIVSGRNGYSTTGGSFNFMRQQIRVAARDCEQGRNADALARIEKVRTLLAHPRHT